MENGFTRQPVTLTRQVYEKILEMIIEHPAEERQVLNEKRLTELFGVSKAPVREALVRLCSEGVLESVPRYGYVVQQVSDRDARDTVRLRANLELQALREWREQFDPARLSELSQLIGEVDLSETDVWALWEDNEAFHTKLAAFAGNRILLRLLSECMNIQRRHYARNVWNHRGSLRVRHVLAPHKSIVTALEMGDWDEAARLLEGDILSGNR